MDFTFIVLSGRLVGLYQVIDSWYGIVVAEQLTDMAVLAICTTGAIQRAFEFFAGRAATGFVVPEWLPTPDNLQYSVAVSRLDRVVYRLIAQRRARLASSASTPEQAG